MVQGGVSQKSQCLSPHAFIPGNTLEFSLVFIQLGFPLMDLLAYYTYARHTHRPYVEVPTHSLQKTMGNNYGEKGRN